ncbi:MAG: hypothetical protein ACRCSF_08435 [Mycobacteriaceae bacterium]
MPIVVGIDDSETIGRKPSRLSNVPIGKEDPSKAPIHKPAMLDKPIRALAEYAIEAQLLTPGRNRAEFTHL